MVCTQSYKQDLLILLDRIGVLYQFMVEEYVSGCVNTGEVSILKAWNFKQAVKHLMEIYAYFPLGFFNCFFSVIICTKQSFGVFWLVGFAVFL